MAKYDFLAIKKEYLTSNKSLDELAIQFGLNASYLRDMAGRENWSKDKEQIQQKASETLAENLVGGLAEINIRHTKVWKRIQDEALKNLEQGEISLEALKGVSQVLKTSIEGERISVGLPISSTKQNISLEVTKDTYEEKIRNMSNEELTQELKVILDKETNKQNVLN